MSLSKTVLVLLLFSVAAVAAAIYAFTQLQGMKATLADEQLSGSDRAARLMAYTKLHAADSVFHAMDYGSALDAYLGLEADSLLSTDGLVEPRLAHTESLMELQSMLDTLRNRRPRTILMPRPATLPDAPMEPVERDDPEKTAPNRYDSLTFALQKAETQVRNLQRRLSRSSGGNYLTFESSEGNDIYYVGEIKAGKANGQGVALLGTGSRYLGEWRDNEKHGTGEFHWTDGAWYEGDYEDDDRSGKGTYHFPDGSMYVGQWQDDLRNGNGAYYDKKGKVVAEGVWKDDELVERE